MISEDPQIEAFIDDHRWAVLSHLRASGAPVSSMVAYARDGDDLVVSTPGFTLKMRALRRDGRASLCIISNAEPFNFVNIEGACSVERDDLERRTRLVFQNISGSGYDEPPDLPAWLEAQQRVILRISPARVHAVIR